MSQETCGSQLPSVYSSLTCQQITDMIIDYTLRELPAATHDLFESHLQNCQDCVAFLNTYQQSIRATRSLRFETIPPEMLNRVHTYLKSKIANDQNT